MKTITSEGLGWELIADGSTRLLKLKCPYGTIEILAKGGPELWMLDDVITEYEKLKASGPIEKAVKS